MPRILKRPMFSRGGSTNKNNGIMTGLVDRKGFENGTKDPDEVVAGMDNELNPGFFDKLPLIGGYEGKYPVDADQGASLIEEIQNYKYGTPPPKKPGSTEIQQEGYTDEYGTFQVRDKKGTPPMSIEQTIAAMEAEWDMAIEEGYEPGKGGKFDNFGIYSKEDIRRRIELGFDLAKGPESSEGIMRTTAAGGGRIGYAEGPTQAEIYADEYYDQLSKIQPPKPKFNVGEFGMNLASGKYAGDGFVSSLIGSGREPYSKFAAADDKRRGLDYNTQISAAKYGISKADAEKIRSEEKAKKLKNAMAKTSFENQKYIITQENDLLKLYKNDKSVQSFGKSSVQLKKMLAALEEDTGAGDVAAVFAFMKTLDPESVVRESEFEVAEGTGGSKLFSFEKAHQLWQKLKTGQRLTEREKQNFKNAGIAFYQADQSSIDNIRSGFENIIKDRGLNRSNIFIDNDIRPFNLEVPFEVKETKGAPPSIKKEFKTEYLDVPPGTKLVDYENGYYYFELPDGRRFKTKGLK